MCRPADARARVRVASARPPSESESSPRESSPGKADSSLQPSESLAAADAGGSDDVGWGDSDDDVADPGRVGARAPGRGGARRGRVVGTAADRGRAAARRGAAAGRGWSRVVPGHWLAVVGTETHWRGGGPSGGVGVPAGGQTHRQRGSDGACACRALPTAAGQGRAARMASPESESLRGAWRQGWRPSPCGGPPGGQGHSVGVCAPRHAPLGRCPRPGRASRGRAAGTAAAEDGVKRAWESAIVARFLRMILELRLRSVEMIFGILNRAVQ